MSIREQAEKIVSDYLTAQRLSNVNRAQLIEAIVDLAVSTYNKGLARAEAIEDNRNTTPAPLDQ